MVSTITLEIDLYMYNLQFLDYVDLIVSEVLYLAQRNSIKQISQFQKENIPASLCDSYEHPNKMEAIKQHSTRFNK